MMQSVAEPDSSQKNRGRSSRSSPTTPNIPPSITKQCLQLHHPDQKFSNDAIELSSEFLKFFVVEARRRAAIEAECEAEAEVDPSSGMNNSKNGDDGSFDSLLMGDGNDVGRKKPIEIRADHIAKVAAELLLDLS